MRFFLAAIIIKFSILSCNAAQLIINDTSNLNLTVYEFPEVSDTFVRFESFKGDTENYLIITENEDLNSLDFHTIFLGKTIGIFLPVANDNLVKKIISKQFKDHCFHAIYIDALKLKVMPLTENNSSSDSTLKMIKITNLSGGIDISIISKFIDLNYLYISGNNEEINTSFLKGMDSLQECYLNHCMFDNYTSVKRLRSLSRLSILGNVMSDEDIKRLRKFLPNCDIVI